MNGGSNLYLARLFVHPIKSCAAIEVERARVAPQGLEHDRRWMVVDDVGRMLTQRVLPRMTLLRPRLDGDTIIVERDREGAVEDAGEREIELAPLQLPSLYDDGPRVEISIWDHRGPAVRHDEGSRWFSAALGRATQLVCLPPSIARPLTPDFARAGETVSFADGFPFLVAGSASLEDLNTRSNFRSDVRRFRPNLVIAGAAPWAEDDWRALRIGGLRFRLLKPCARCSIPAIDPDSGALDKEPLKTLATFRKRDNQIYFGINAVADDVGELRVGDEVTVDEP